VYDENLLHFVYDEINLATMDRAKPAQRGRPPIGNRALTSTERSKRRIERLTAREVAEGTMRDGLEKLHGELVTAGVPDRAGDVANILQTTALKAVAEYTRRMAMFFAQSGPKSFNSEEKSAHEKRIIDLSVKIDSLAITDNSSYEQFDEILQQLHALGFFPDNSLVSDVARAFYVGR
jgi:hypothetical protein